MKRCWPQRPVLPLGFMLGATAAQAAGEGAMIGANAAALKSADHMPALMALMAGHNKTTLENWSAERCAALARRLSRAEVAVMSSLMVSDFYLGKDPAPDDWRMRSVPKTVCAQWGQGVLRPRNENTW